MPKVLVVDDSEMERRLAGGLLEMALKVELVYAVDGKDALAKVPEHQPVLVVTDLQMPEMNGLELVAALKAEHPLIPVVLMTAQGSEDIAAEALRRGAASYVPKRRLAEDLADTVARVLQGSSEDRAHSQLMHHLAADECTFVLHNDPELIRSLSAHFQELLRCLPLRDETERMRVSLAVEEALTNACYHGNLEAGSPAAGGQTADYRRVAEQRRFEAPYRDRRIHVRAQISRREAVFVIRDEGRGFDTSRLPDAADPEALQGPTGRGIKLMRSIMDEVRFSAAGNQVTLTKRRALETLEDCDADDDDESLA
jgi:CheY-like chemotaxis protein/anti-sigma regulatory factor (Ser/Thr protein kinase)